jgi:hypothetical protein
MSKITLTPHASGTGTLNIAAPNTNSTRTLTLPDADLNLADVLTTSSSLASANLTGALPAISGAALTGIATGMVYDLLGTLATTSGASATLSGLVLTSYKQIQFVFDGVSTDGVSNYLLLNGWRVAHANYLVTGDYCAGFGFIDLTTGIFGSCGNARWNGNDGTNGSAGGGYSGVTTASTSITFAPSGGTASFDSGSIKFYGVA